MSLFTLPEKGTFYDLNNLDVILFSMYMFEWKLYIHLSIVNQVLI